MKPVKSCLIEQVTDVLTYASADTPVAAAVVVVVAADDVFDMGVNESAFVLHGSVEQQIVRPID